MRGYRTSSSSIPNLDNYNKSKCVVIFDYQSILSVDCNGVFYQIELGGELWPESQILNPKRGNIGHHGDHCYRVS